MLRDGTVKTREQVVADVRRGVPYYTKQSPFAPIAYLEVVEPTNAFYSSAYVRTRPDCTNENNLLSLPRF